MSVKNTLEAKRLRKASKQKDRGYPEFYQEVRNGNYSKFVGPKTSTSNDPMKQMKTLFAKLFMEGFFKSIGIKEKEVVE